MSEKKIKILITGDNGESLPPPYGGIIKRCLLHAKEWRSQHGAQVFIHIHHRHGNEEDLDAGARYFYDFAGTPRFFDKLIFIAKNFLTSPVLFLNLFFLQMRLAPYSDIPLFLYCAARANVLKRAIKDFAPDIVITETGGYQSLVSTQVAKSFGLPVILENYAEIQFKQGRDADNVAEKFAPLWEYILEKVDLVIPASAHCKLGPVKYVGDDKIKIIYSGINFDIFHGNIGQDKKMLRQKFNLPGDKFLVMAVGALRARKGHDHLMEALLEMPEGDRQNMGLVLCGMGSADDVRKGAEALGFSKDSLFIFQGLSEKNLAQLYGAMDCFCFPSMTPRECMGMAMKEAMAIGLPIAAYNSGGIKEAIENGQNGFLVPVGDKHSLALAAKKIKDLSADEIFRMREANVKKARDIFDIKKTADGFFYEIVKLIS